MKLYFLSSGALGIPALERIRHSPCLRLVGIGTQPDRGAGRHRHLHPTPLGCFADENGLGAERVPDVNAPEFITSLEARAPDIILVISFGQLLRRTILELPPFGCLNVHASLLPRHRGASPVNAVILKGDTKTGISFMRMDKGLDTGPVYGQEKTEVFPDDTPLQLEPRLAELAAANIEKCLWSICRQGLQPEPQPDTGVTVARKLHKDDGIADWRLPAAELERRVRGLQPWPRLSFFLSTPKGQRRIQILEAVIADENVNSGSAPLPPGEIRITHPAAWEIGCADKTLIIKKIIPEGRGEMQAADFLNGAHFLRSGMQV